MSSSTLTAMVLSTSTQQHTEPLALDGMKSFLLTAVMRTTAHFLINQHGVPRPGATLKMTARGLMLMLARSLASHIPYRTVTELVVATTTSLKSPKTKKKFPIQALRTSQQQDLPSSAHSCSEA